MSAPIGTAWSPRKRTVDPRAIQFFKPVPRSASMQPPAPPPRHDVRPPPGTKNRQHVDGVFNFDWKALYGEALAANDSLENEDVTSKATIERQEKAMQGLTREQQRLCAGETVPQWVVSELDASLRAVEAERDRLKAQLEHERVQTERSLAFQRSIEAAVRRRLKADVDRLNDEMAQARADAERQLSDEAAVRRRLEADVDRLTAEMAQARADEEQRRSAEAAERRRLEAQLERYEEEHVALCELLLGGEGASCGERLSVDDVRARLTAAGPTVRIVC
jgi:hypothetical protein